MPSYLVVVSAVTALLIALFWQIRHRYVGLVGPTLKLTLILKSTLIKLFRLVYM